MVNPLQPNQVSPVTPAPKADPSKRTTAGALSFGQVLESTLQKGQATGLKFSAHANERMQSRRIELSSNDLARLEQGVAQAQAKGSRESLVLKDNLAFVISIKNQTVITAVDAQSLKNNVFTNIDSAVIV